jgi:preprotein translocase subunit SecB
MEEGQGSRMSPAQKELIAQAAKALKIRGLFLYQSKFLRPTNPPEDAAEVLRQDRRGVEWAVGEGPDKSRQLEVKVSLGLRVMERDAPEAKVYLVIEAEFAVVYSMEGDLRDEALNAFAEFNAVHNVWPFWRQHVFDIVKRGDLPDLIVPLFSGTVG